MKQKSIFWWLLIVCFTVLSANAQKVIQVTGSVKNVQTNELVPAVSVMIKGSSVGAFTNDKGDFSFSTAKKPPFTLVVSSVGYVTKEILFTGKELVVSFQPGYVLGDEVVVAASRAAERILESPVSVERISNPAIRTTPATSYYDILGNQKGVDVTTSSFTFKSISTRGFNGSGNLRLNQIVDGMDNQAPGLNFAVGSIIGLTELDVDNMELLSGASSALYGPGGMNGTLLINSKSPFKYQGLSFQIKQGANHLDRKQRDERGAFYDWSIRYAQKINDKLAYKLGMQIIQAKDWLATNQGNYLRPTSGSALPYGQTIPGDRNSDPNYDGVNLYGDETNTPIQPVLGQVGAGFVAAGLAPKSAIDAILATVPATQLVSRTGYAEKDVVDPNTLNYKLTGAIHYKVTNQIEAIVAANIGVGNTVYTGSDRYSLKNLRMGQYKLELKAKNWYLRAYTTHEDAGDSYNATIASRYFNEKWKSSTGATGWFAQYAQAYLQARLKGAANSTAHISARAVADNGRPTGPVYEHPLFQQLVSTPISDQGALFVDQTNLKAAEGQWNLTDALKLNTYGSELIVGGNFRRFSLNSKGTLFADTAGKINIDEVGTYAQLSQKIADIVKLTFSGRYDKNTNFKGRFTPRFSAVVKLAKDHNLRMSYQQAYRFPSTQNQWIRLVINSGTILLGGLPQLRDVYNFNGNPAYSQASLMQFAATGNPAVLKPQVFSEFKPENSASYEVGYKGLIGKKLLIDVYGYVSDFENFITNVNVVQSTNGSVAGLANANTRRVFVVATNAPGRVKTRGYGVSVDYLLPKNFSVAANVYSDEMYQKPADASFVTFYNTPKYRTNFSVSNNGFGTDKRYGFSATYRWQEAFDYEGTFAVGKVPAFSTVDAMISYKYPKIKSLVKLGGTNLLNKYYVNGFGNAQVGALYYVAFSYNVF